MAVESRQRLGLGDASLVAIVCLAWAGNFLTSKLALREFPPLLFTVLRMMLLTGLLAGTLKPPARGQWPRLIAVALCIGVLHFGLNFWALKLSATVASPAIVLQSYAPMAALLAWWVLGERFDKRTGIAIAVSFAGVLMLGMDPAVLQSPAALALMLISAFFLALGTVLMRDLVGLDVFSQQGWTAAIALLPLCALSVALEPNALEQLSQAGWTVWLGVAYSALVASLIGHGLYYRLVQKHPVASITPLLLAVPLLAAGLGVVFLGDALGPRLWLGAAMILGGVVAIGTRFRRKA